ncbi:hypothetical protein ACRRTK_004485 [Alexandromys fortis]
MQQSDKNPFSCLEGFPRPPLRPPARSRVTARAWPAGAPPPVAHASGPQITPPPPPAGDAELRGPVGRKFGSAPGKERPERERTRPVRAGERAPPWQLGPPAPAPVLRNPGARRQPTQPRRSQGSSYVRAPGARARGRMGRAGTRRVRALPRAGGGGCRLLAAPPLPDGPARV